MRILNRSVFKRVEEKKKKIVLFDAFELAPNGGKSLGIYKYAVCLFRALLENIPPTILLLVVCNPSCAKDFDCGSHSNAKRLIHSKRPPGKVSRQLWLKFGAQMVARKYGADVYFSPKGFLPGIWGHSLALKTVVVLHDLIPLWYEELYPGHFGRLEEYLVYSGLRRSVRHADHVIAISRATADDAKAKIGRCAKISVVHNGLPLYQPGQALFDFPYIFAICSSLPHKNAKGVLAAYAKYRVLANAPLPLVVCGITDPKMDGVIAVTGLTNAELHACYRDARAFLFLSLIEGFGFPPLEAMSYGVPVLCSDIPSLREITCGAALLAPPEDSDISGRSLRDVVENEAIRSTLVARGLNAVAKYSWRRCARGVISVLDAV